VKFSIRRVDVRNALIRVAINTMHAECFPRDEPVMPNDGDWWVAFHGKHEAGFIGFVKSTRALSAAYLCSVGVLKKYRGNRLQTRLTRTALPVLKEQYDTVVTDCRCFNPASANSLIRCGFHVYLPDWPWSFKDAIYWRREL
jgi:RimJ/RimL family protein N-acetyltransferase